MAERGVYKWTGVRNKESGVIPGSVIPDSVIPDSTWWATQREVWTKRNETAVEWMSVWMAEEGVEAL